MRLRLVALAAFALTLPGLAHAGDFVDTRLNFTLTDENLLVKPGETNPSVPGLRIGMPSRLGILFFDNYDTRYSGYENLSHVVVYRKKEWKQNEAETAFVLRVLEISDLTNQIIDDGSYIKITHYLSPERTNNANVSATLFPLSGDRMRLGFSYRISWGGSPVTETLPAPSVRMIISGATSGSRLRAAVQTR